MKTLYLLRHATADRGDARLDDHDRPLAPQGEQACAKLGTFFAGSGRSPDVALCSTARRAVDTLQRVASHLAQPPLVRLERSLYLATPREMLERLSGLEPEFECAILVGHNPGLHQLAADLAGRGDADALERLSRRFPTAALAELRFCVGSWAEVALDRGELMDLITPKQLPDS